MTGFGAHSGDGGLGSSWRALSGESLPDVPSLGASPSQPASHQPLAEPAPVEGGWQQAWQDEHGQWHSPYARQQAAQVPPYHEAAASLAEPQPGYAPVPALQPEPAATPEQPAPFVVPAEQLAPVGPPRYLAPSRVARDPRQRTLAAVITFVALLVGLWAMLGFLGSLSQSLSSIVSGNQKLKLQMTEANKGLVSLDEKTRGLEGMSANSAEMGRLLVQIDKDMGTMLGGVDGIADGMSSLSGSLGTLDTELGKVNDINAGMATQLVAINAGLKEQVASERAMRRDVQATDKVIATLPKRLAATNKRLAFINSSVNTMGCGGIGSNLRVKLSVGGISPGSASVFATVVPPSAWGTKADGKTPC